MNQGMWASSNFGVGQVDSPLFFNMPRRNDEHERRPIINRELLTYLGRGSYPFVASTVLNEIASWLESSDLTIGIGAYLEKIANSQDTELSVLFDSFVLSQLQKLGFQDQEIGGSFSYRLVIKSMTQEGKVALLDTLSNLDYGLIKRVFGWQIRQRYNLFMYLSSPSDQTKQVINFLHSTTFREWYGETDIATFPHQSHVFLSQQWVYFLTSPSIDIFMKRYEPQSFFDAIELTQKCDLELWKLVKQMCETPHADTLIKYALDNNLADIDYDDSYSMETSYSRPWNERLQSLIEVSEILKTDAVSDVSLSMALYENWNPSLPEVYNLIEHLAPHQYQRLYALLNGPNDILEYNVHLTSTASSMDSGTKLVFALQRFAKERGVPLKQVLYHIIGTEVLSQLRKGTQFVDRQAYRQYLRTTQDTAQSKEALSTQLDLVKYWEDPRHPTTNLRCTLGYEVEYSPTQGVGMLPLAILHRMGIRIGGGGAATNQEGLVAEAEVSPGPFYHPFTVALSMKMWTDAELFHWHQAKQQTLHLNAGVSNEHSYNKSVRMLQLTGHAYSPLYMTDPEYKKGFDLGSYTVNHAQTSELPRHRRIESKDFLFCTPLGFEKLMYSAAALLTAEKAYDAAIAHTTLSQYEKELALVWRNACQVLTDAVITLGCPNGIDRILPADQAEKIGQELLTVYPSVWEQYDQTLLNGSTPAGPVTIENTEYSNIVAGAQAVLSQVSNDVEEILSRAETDVYQQLAEVEAFAYDQDSLEQFDFKIDAFFDTFPWLERNLEGIEKDRTILFYELLEFAQQHGKI
ncbi:MAG: hypothetical protein M3Q81_02095 [bacterium]|nr:hypothetical protein [bacterium]